MGKSSRALKLHSDKVKLIDFLFGFLFFSCREEKRREYRGMSTAFQKFIVMIVVMETHIGTGFAVRRWGSEAVDITACC